MTPRAGAAALFIVMSVSLVQPARAQSIADKIKKAAQAARDSLAKTGNNLLSSQAANVLGATLATVTEGNFRATLSPWVLSDGSETLAAHFVGSAVAASAGGAYRVQLCDNSGAQALTTTLMVPATASGGHAVVTEKQYSLPANGVYVSVTSAGGNTGAVTVGTLTIGAATATTFGGSGKLTFGRAIIPGRRDARSVVFDVTLKARILQPGEAMPACTARAAAITSAQPAPQTPPAAVPPATTPPASSPQNQSVAGRIQAAVDAASKPFAEGDVLVPRNGAKLLADANDRARVLTTLKSKDEVVYAGRENQGFVYVRRLGLSGWVKKSLVSRR